MTALGLGFALCAAPAAAEEVLPPPPLVETEQVAPATPAPPAQAAASAPAVPPQSTTTTTVTTTTQTPAAPPAPPAVVARPPLPAVPAPPPGTATGPMYYNGPVWVIPAPVTAQPLGPQALPPPPVFTQPGYRARTARCCAALPQARLAEPRPPIFSVGARFTATGINQEVFGQPLTMLGGGLQLRFRNRGHWGFETAFDVLRANVGDGAFVRMSYPWSAAVMLYIFQNRSTTHFNIFGLAGLGLAADDITLYQGSRQERNQQFLSLLGQAGAGVELRFRHLALSADLRAVGMMLDTTGPAGAFYQDVEGGPIPATSIGYKANLGALVWF